MARCRHGAAGMEARLDLGKFSLLAIAVGLALLIGIAAFVITL
jgi:hypothetical protein